MIHEYEREGFRVSTDPTRLDVDVVHNFLTNSYWIPGVPRARVERAIRHSLCFGLYDGTEQVGFARVTTDHTHFAYVMDVFVLTPYRGRGLGRWLMECILDWAAGAGIRRIMLATRGAQGFYAKLGFQPLSRPEIYMELRREAPWSQEDEGEG
jgi:GNAT superfamily N-acetyltransferase